MLYMWVAISIDMRHMYRCGATSIDALHVLTTSIDALDHIYRATSIDALHVGVHVALYMWRATSIDAHIYRCGSLSHI